MNEKKLSSHFDFQGGKFIVAGASSGIGRQICGELVRSGAAVLAVARSESDLRTLSREFGAPVTICAADVRDGEKLHRSVEQFVDCKGRVDGSVYCAGISAPTPLKCYSQDDADAVMDINYWGFVNLMKIVTRRKYSSNGSSHVALASAAGHNGVSANFAYGASKAAVINTVKTFAKEIYKRQCRMNSISPGIVSTAMSDGYFDRKGFSETVRSRHLLGLGECRDVSGLVMFLLSDNARWITGQDFVVDGGYEICD